MPKSLITKNHPISLPAPLDDILSARLHSEDGGQKYELQLKLADGFEPGTMSSLIAEFISAVKSRDQAIKKGRVEAAAKVRQAKEARQAQIIEAEAQTQRQARRSHFLRVEESHKTVKFDPASMWRTRDRNLALKIAESGVLEFIGPSDDYSFAFRDEQHVGDQFCRRCLNFSLKRSKPNSGGAVMVTCSTTDCHYHTWESSELPQRPHSVLHGRVQLRA